jgi:hypothetical protein
MKKPKKAHKQPAMPLEDWLPALRNTTIDSAYYWVTNKDDVVIDAAETLAEAVGMSVYDFIGKHYHEFAGMVISPPREHRDADMQRLLADGGSITRYTIAKLADREEVTTAVVTSTCLVHPDNGKKYLMHIAHDITKLEAQLDYLQAPAFQVLIILIIEKNGKVLAATDAAARFIKPGAQRGSDVRGMSLKETPYPEVKEREASELRRSWLTGQPSQAIDWLWSANNDYRPYAVSRICFPQGRWMIIMIPVPATEPWMQIKDAKQVLKANNLNQPAQVSVKQFEALVDKQSRRTREEAAAFRNVSVNAIDDRLKKLRAKFKVESTNDLLPAIAYTELGYLVKLYADRVVPEDND